MKGLYLRPGEARSMVSEHSETENGGMQLLKRAIKRGESFDHHELDGLSQNELQAMAEAIHELLDQIKIYKERQRFRPKLSKAVENALLLRAILLLPIAMWDDNRGGDMMRPNLIMMQYDIEFNLQQMLRMVESRIELAA